MRPRPLFAPQRLADSHPLVRLRWAAGVLCLTLAATLSGQQPALATPFVPPRPQPIPSVPVKPLPVKAHPADPAAIAAGRSRPAATWPAAGTAEVDLPAPDVLSRSASAPRARQVGTLPISVGSPEFAARGSVAGTLNNLPRRVRADLTDPARARSAGLAGVVFSVSRADGAVASARVGVAVDYSAFRTAYGADWASRLRLVALTGCTDALVAGCTATPLPSHNDVVAGRVGADVDLVAPAASQPDSAPAPAALVALLAGPAGSSGSFAATALAPSSTWSAGSSSGDFSWSYPLLAPPPPAGAAPQLRLSYSSQAVDGRNAASNNQPSEIGEGFEYAPGSIERGYRSCSDDLDGGANNTTKTFDQCWASANAVMSLNGHSAELIADASGGWHLRNDDGSRVEHLTGATNGDNDGEYWKVTTIDGTQYWFGRNRLPGWSLGRPETSSVQSVPVFGNNVGEPCHQATFALSSCDQAYRWNLDYVVDVHGNSTSLWYSQESNYYARNADSAHSVKYARASFLEHIDYGTRVDPDLTSGTDSVFAGPASARIVFESGDRCLSACATHDGTHWTDTPWDQTCGSGAECFLSSPTFWSTKRVTSITTQVWDATRSALKDVDRWQLRQSFPDPGDGTRAGLWLAGITHTGLVGGSTSLPEVTFDGTQLANRADGLDQSPAMNWWRIAAIHTETGGMISVNYSAPDCVPGSRMPGAPESNTLRCYPVRWTPEGATGPIVDYFQKYVVTSVIETDSTGGAPAVVTAYSYLTAPAWHYTDDDGVVAEANKTWSQWRGYGLVGVTKGYPGEQDYAETRYFRGMNGDRLPTGTRTVTVTDSEGGSWPDDDAFAGMTREQTIFNGPGGAEVSGTLTDPWESEPTATRGNVTARHIATKATHTRTTLDGGRGFRRTTSVSDFDGYGHVTQIEDRSDDADPNDTRCTRYTYVTNTSAWLIDLVGRTESYAKPCGQPATRAEDVISDVRTSYDGGAYAAPPVRGDATQVETLTSWAAGVGTYSVTSRTGFDASGRTTDKWDEAGKHTSTAFTPATGPVTTITTTGPLGFRSTTDVEPAWGSTVRSIDANNKVTAFTYDPLNRLTEVYQPGRVKGTDTPSARIAYQMRSDATTATSVSKLGPNGVYTTSYTIYDSLLREREVQKPSPTGGRIILETLYDSAARPYRSLGPYHDGGAPGTDLVTATDLKQVARQTLTLFDGADRAVATVFKPYDQERWRTSTYYGGDHVDVTPPAGGSARATLTDARGQVVSVRQFHGNQPGGAYDPTTYRYDGRGYLTEVVDSSGNRWTYSFDVRGRPTGGVDPDAGDTTIGYDNAGRVQFRQDGRGQKLVYGYDDLGRTTSLSDGSGTKLAAWTFDTLAKGYLTSSTRYVNGNAYTVAVRGYTDLYNPTGTTVTIPAVEGKLAGTYQYRTSYNVDGSTASATYPRAGGLAPETVMYTYDDLGESKTVGTIYDVTESSYVTDTEYDALAELSQFRFSTGTGGNVYESLTYELDTGRITDAETTRDSRNPNLVSHLHYDYEAAGSVTKISDRPGSGTTDTQCFTHDYLLRVTEAWTPASGDCASAPSAGLGGPAPYWESWRFDLAGDRQNQTNHATPLGDVSVDYARPAAGSRQPHGTTSTTQRDNAGTHVQSYGYDASGNTTSRPGPAGQQTLTWDAEGHVASVIDATGRNDYVYDAADRRLIEHDPAGATLYLPNTELRLNAATQQVTATRYYTATGGIVCQRTSAGVTWLISDHHGTGYLAIDATTQIETRRRLDPYGNPRGANGTWPNPRGFVGGDSDPTGLMHLGAREYDPATGSFTSVDPKIDLNAPETLNPYGYGGNNPVTYSDPDGLSWLNNLVKTLKACNNSATWAGIGMMVLGGIADAGGGLLIATGVGAPLGAALEVVGTEAIVAGAVTATAGIVAGCAQNIMNSVGSDSGGGGGGGDTPAKQPHPYKAEADKLMDEHQGNVEGGAPLTEVNAYKAIEEDVPPGTRPVAKGKGQEGPDIDFVDGNGNVVLRREVKTATSKSSFEHQLSEAGKRLNYEEGEVDVQVPRGTTANQVRNWLENFRANRRPSGNLGKYSRITVRVRDEDGVDLGKYNAAQEPPPQPPHHGSVRFE